MQAQIDHLIYHYSYTTLFILSFVYFLVLYFVLGPLFLATCRFMATKGLLRQIISKEVSGQQLNFEMKQSFKSIIVFGFSIIPVIMLVRNGFAVFLPDTFFSVLSGVMFLTLWNEVHFFCIHRIMHLPFFMKHIHIVHHQSNVPTVYSVYSFHWIEALLLSTVPLTILPFFSFSALAVFIYPIASILLNYAGHCNYRFGNGEGRSWQLFGTHHNEHHHKGRKNYGFATNLLDKLISGPKK